MFLQAIARLCQGLGLHFSSSIKVFLAELLFSLAVQKARGAACSRARSHPPGHGAVVAGDAHPDNLVPLSTQAAFHGRIEPTGASDKAIYRQLVPTEPFRPRLYTLRI